MFAVFSKWVLKSASSVYEQTHSSEWINKSLNLPLAQRKRNDDNDQGSKWLIMNQCTPDLFGGCYQLIGSHYSKKRGKLGEWFRRTLIDDIQQRQLFVSQILTGFSGKERVFCLFVAFLSNIPALQPDYNPHTIKATEFWSAFISFPCSGMRRGQSSWTFTPHPSTSQYPLKHRVFPGHMQCFGESHVPNQTVSLGRSNSAWRKKPPPPARPAK